MRSIRSRLSKGSERVDELLDAVVTSARRKGAKLPFAANTAYVNTIRPRISRRIPASASSNRRSAATSAGTRRRSCCAPTRNPPSSAAISRASSRRRRSTTPASCISGAPPTRAHGGDLVYFQGHIFARHLRARLPRRTPDRGAARQLPSGGRRQGAVVLSASLADAGLLAVPHGVDGPRAADGDLSGPLPALSARPRARRHRRAQGLGVLRRRRDGRAGIARRDLARRPREARQPDLRHQLQSAAPRRAGARQRQDRPGARGGFPRRRLERHQVPVGLRLGSRCWPRTARASCAS